MKVIRLPLLHRDHTGDGPQGCALPGAIAADHETISARRSKAYPVQGLDAAVGTCRFSNESSIRTLLLPR